MIRLIIALLTSIIAGCAQTPLSTTESSPAIDKKNEALLITDTENALPTTATESSDVSTEEAQQLWRDFSQTLTLNDTQRPEVKTALLWYKKNIRLLHKSQYRMQLFLSTVLKELSDKNVPADIALIPIIESQYNPHAIGRGTAGLWQFTKGTGINFKLVNNPIYDGRLDPVASSKAAAAYMRYLLTLFDNDVLLAIAAYNAGEGTVQKAVKRNKNAGLARSFWSLPLSSHTKQYVAKVIALSIIYQQPEAYGLKLDAINNSTSIRTIQVSSKLSLQQIQSALGIPRATFNDLNAGIKNTALISSNVMEINIPSSISQAAIDELKHLPQKKSSIKQQAKISINKSYTVQSGDSLSKIAARFKTTAKEIIILNRLQNDTIKPKQNLLIPNQGSSKSTTGFNTVHLVKSGDSLYSIAKRYKVTVNDIAQWNRKKTSTPLKIGEKIIILQP